MKNRFIGSFVLLFMQFSQIAEAIIGRHDVPDAAYIEEGKKFQAVGQVLIYDAKDQLRSSGTGTWVQDRATGKKYILTAAHLLDPEAKKITFQLAGTEYSIANTFSLPESPSKQDRLDDLRSKNDLAMLYPVVGPLVEPIALYDVNRPDANFSTYVDSFQSDKTSLLSEEEVLHLWKAFPTSIKLFRHIEFIKTAQVAIVGYGVHKDDAATVKNTSTWHMPLMTPSSSEEDICRAGYTCADSLYIHKFRDPASSTAHSLEAIATSGDSGGPVLIQQDGEWKVMGVISTTVHTPWCKEAIAARFPSRVGTILASIADFATTRRDQKPHGYWITNAVRRLLDRFAKRMNSNQVRYGSEFTSTLLVPHMEELQRVSAPSTAPVEVS